MLVFTQYKQTFSESILYMLPNFSQKLEGPPWSLTKQFLACLLSLPLSKWRPLEAGVLKLWPEGRMRPAKVIYQARWYFRAKMESGCGPLRCSHGML